MKTTLRLTALAVSFLATFASAQTSPVPTTPPPDAAALNKQSIESLQQKKAKEAVEFAEQAIQADPANAAYYSQLGVALSARMNEVNFIQMAGLSSKLKKAFDKSVALDPNHVPGLIGLSRFYTRAPEIATAMPKLSPAAGLGLFKICAGTVGGPLIRL